MKNQLFTPPPFLLVSLFLSSVCLAKAEEVIELYHGNRKFYNTATFKAIDHNKVYDKEFKKGETYLFMEFYYPNFHRLEIFFADMNENTNHRALNHNEAVHAIVDNSNDI